MKKRIAVYPGSFDPVTNGHVDIIERACKNFDSVIVGVLINRHKKPVFSPDERAEMIRKSLKHLPNVTVDCFSGLLVDFMRRNNITVAIRGLRAVSDLEYEFQLAHTNRLLYPEMETVFLMPNVNYVYLSSTTVREVASHGAELTGCVPPCVADALREKFKNEPA
ncbi:MAG: pantetheine-phosphate adenylyltransferase [Elusimicrobiaceae bacterium]|nr:pantetheine-phosphate adenylyltransferase [Elusimicrobiaceae bacterium]